MSAVDDYLDQYFFERPQLTKPDRTIAGSYPVPEPWRTVMHSMAMEIRRHEMSLCTCKPLPEPPDENCIVHGEIA